MLTESHAEARHKMSPFLLAPGFHMLSVGPVGGEEHVLSGAAGERNGQENMPAVRPNLDDVRSPRPVWIIHEETLGAHERSHDLAEDFRTLSQFEGVILILSSQHAGASLCFFCRHPIG